jgi:uncharacterized protein (TIGR03083 family)
MPRTDSWGLAAPTLEIVPVLAAFHDGVTVICELAAQFSGDDWSAPTPCPEWRAADLAGHLRCVADDYNEYLDDAPASRFARLMATGAHPETLERKLARQNAAELAALPDDPAPQHIAAFAESARAYARRLAGVWNLPHHRYRDTVVTVAGMAEAACAEWHLHAWDLARALGQDYRPAAPGLVLAGWRAGMPHLQAARGAAARGASARGAAAQDSSARDASARDASSRDPLSRGLWSRGAAARGAILPGGRWPVVLRGDRWRAALRSDPWRTLLLASGRSPEWRA